MHILRNIPQSTLGYFCGESLISINENEIHKAELVEIAKREFHKYNIQQADLYAVTNVPIAVGFYLVKEMKTENEHGFTRPFKMLIMPSPDFHVKVEDIFMYDNQDDNYPLPGERHLKANPYWLPYYPWMWFARHALMEFGKKNHMSLPFELAKRVTSYFDWNINEHLDTEFEEKWPKVPADFGDPKHFHWSTKSLVYSEPKVYRSPQVPRFTLTSYQPNWVLSYFSFCERCENTDKYLWNNFHYEKYEESWEAHQISEGYTDKEDQKYITPKMQEFLADLKTKEPHPKILQWFPNPVVMDDSDSDDQLFSDDSSKTAMTT